MIKQEHPPMHTDGTLATPTIATHVTFFEDRAQVTRTARVHVPAGQSWTTLSGMSPMLHDPTLAAHLGSSDARMLSAKVKRHMPVWSDDNATVVQRLNKDKARAQREEGQAAATLTRLDLEQARLKRMESGVFENLTRDATSCSLEQWRAMWARLDESGDAHQVRAKEAFEAIARAHERTAALQAELDTLHNTERDMQASVEVNIESAEATELTVTLTYIVPCALWRPSHIARLVQRDVTEGGARVNLASFATVWHATGEKWENVSCAFSTARPSGRAMPDTLTTDALNLRTKSHIERKTIQVEAREQTIALTGASSDSQGVDAMPGVDDGGAPLELHALHAVTIPEHAGPFVVQLSTHTLPVEVNIVAYPERTPIAHYKASGVWRGDQALLAGPVTIMRGGQVVGTARAPFVAIGESFDLGFGPHQAIRVQRDQEQEDTSKKLSTKTRITRTVTLFVTNMSPKRHTLTLIERVPISEVDAVRVHVSREDRDYVDEHGFWKRTIDLAPHQHRKIELEYITELDSGVRMMF